MGFLKKLFKSDPKTKCVACGHAIKEGNKGAMPLATQSPRQMEQQALSHGRKCPNCGSVTCSICSHDAAKRLGKTYFVCASCGADIRGHDV